MLPSERTTVGLVADTHGVYDPAAADQLSQVSLILHAGDVGNHGGHREVLQQFAAATNTPIVAVSGNVDDDLDAEGRQLLPQHRLLTVVGWKVLLTHIVAPGPQAKVDPAAASLINELQPDIVVFGHSHKAGCWCKDGVYYINPGSAGPARFKLPRTVARLLLPQLTPDGSTDGSTIIIPGGSTDGGTIVTPDRSTDGSTIVTPDGSTDGSAIVTPDGSTNGSTIVKPDGGTDGSTTVTPGGSTNGSTIVSELGHIQVEFCQLHAKAPRRLAARK